MKTRFLLTAVIPAFALASGNAEAEPADNPVDLREWEVPWEESQPRDPYVAEDGRVWFVGQRGDYVANFVPETGDFNRYDLDQGTGPHNLLVDSNHDIWYAGNLANHIGHLDPDTGRVTKIEMPRRDARDPHTMTFDSSGNIWFTVQQGNYVGRLTVADQGVELAKIATGRSRPYGIVVDSRDTPWVATFGSHKLVRVDPSDLSLAEIELPNTDSRPRRLQTGSDDNIWYVDYARGFLGRYKPETGAFDEWPMPGGSDSRPYGMAIDRYDRIWVVETGVVPNRFVGFETASEEFFSLTGIPSGGGTVRHMYYFEPAGEVWFGTDTNRIGRAKVH